MDLQTLATTCNDKLRFAQQLHDTCPTVLMYHSVGVDGGYDNVSVANFRNQIEWLDDQYNVVELSDVLDVSNEGPKNVAITFDDGLASFYQNAQSVLQEYSVPATVFVCSAAVEESMSDRLETIVDERIRTPEQLMSTEELREIAADPLFTIGAHTKTHPKLPEIDSNSELIDEVVGSKKVLESALDTTVDQFAYPCNEWDTRSQDIVCETYEHAVFGGGLTSLITAETCRHRIPRISAGGSVEQLQLSVTDTGKQLAKLYKNLAQ